MVVSWMVANAILAMAVSESYAGTGVGDNFYLKFILWSVASVALFRALGSGAFRVINLVGTVVEGRHKFWERMPSWLGGEGLSRSSGSGGGSSWGSWSERISDKVSSIGSGVGR